MKTLTIKECERQIHVWLTKVKQHQTTALAYAKEAGKWLEKSKVFLKPGQYKPWVQRTFQINPRTAADYIRVHQNWDLVKDAPSLWEAVWMIRKHQGRVGSQGGLLTAKKTEQRWYKLIMAFRRSIKDWSPAQRTWLVNNVPLLCDAMGKLKKRCPLTQAMLEMEMAA